MVSTATNKTSKEKGVPTVKIEYPEEVKMASICNKGSTVQINIGKEEQCRLLIDDDEYNLVQFHFHSPSEHCVDSTQFAMEMHLVHFNAKGHIAVLGFLYNATSQSEAVKDGGNAFLRYFWDQLPSKETDHEIPLKRSLRFGSLFGGSGDREWITYNGSLSSVLSMDSALCLRFCSLLDMLSVSVCSMFHVDDELMTR